MDYLEELATEYFEKNLSHLHMSEVEVSDFISAMWNFAQHSNSFLKESHTNIQIENIKVQSQFEGLKLSINQILLSYKLDGKYSEKEALVEISKLTCK